MKKVILMLAIAASAMLIIGCQQKKQVVSVETEEKGPLLKTGISPVDTINIVEDFLIGVYMPTSADELKQSIKKLAPIATEGFLNQIAKDVGQYDESKQGSIRGIEVSIGLPENLTKNYMKILASFMLVTKEGLRQEILLEFRCTPEDYITNYTVWLRNAD